MVGLFTSYGRVLLFSVVHKLYITHTLRLGGACDKSRTSHRECVDFNAIDNYNNKKATPNGHSLILNFKL